MNRSPSVFKVAGLQGRSFTLRYDHHAKLGRSAIDYTLELLSWPNRVRRFPIELFTDHHGLRRGVPARLISQRAHVRLRARIGALGAALVFDARAPAEGMISRLQRRHIQGLKQGRLARAMPRIPGRPVPNVGRLDPRNAVESGITPLAPLRLQPERD
jgi:hypothetical protein